VGPDAMSERAAALDRREGEALLGALAARRSVAVLDPEAAVPQEAVERALELAVLAPNHRLTQPWRFTVLRGPARQRAGQALAAEAVAQGRIAAERASFEAAKWLRAPVVVVVSHTPAEDAVTGLEDRLACGAAVENMLLALEAQGLAAMWRTGASAASAAVKAAIDLAPDDEILALVYVGQPRADVPPPPRRRRAASEVTRWLDR
jgi:nitroreductase